MPLCKKGNTVEARIACKECDIMYCSVCFVKRHSKGTFKGHVMCERLTNPCCADCETDLCDDYTPCKSRYILFSMPVSCGWFGTGLRLLVMIFKAVYFYLEPVSLCLRIFHCSKQNAVQI